MWKGFTVKDGSVLCGLLAESPDDIVIKLDRRGFITSASPAIARLGVALDEFLVPPHLSDLPRPSHASALRTYLEDTMDGMAPQGRIEFPSRRTCDAGRGEWYTLSLRPTCDEYGEIAGALGVLHAAATGHRPAQAIQHLGTVDPLTGLANRAAFIAMMSRALTLGERGCLAVFAIDRFRAVKLRFGQSRSDEVLWAFAQFLRSILGEAPSFARIEAERFAVIVPGVSMSASKSAVGEALQVFAEISREGATADMALTASAGVCALEGMVETVVSRAEIALTVAAGAGGGRVELADTLPGASRYRRRA